MKKTGLDFNSYIMFACKYAFLEYEFGLDSKAALFQIDESMLEKLGSCWVSFVSVPDAARMIARERQEHQEF